MAKTFTVPIGNKPSVAALPARPLTTSLIVPSPPAATIFVNPSAGGVTRHCFGFAGSRRCAKRAAARQRLHPRAPAFRAFAIRGRVENDDGVIHNWDKALIFSSNWGCVTSSRAENQPTCGVPVRGSDWTGGRCLDRRELVCAIARDTSEDSAGT